MMSLGLSAAHAIHRHKPEKVSTALPASTGASGNSTLTQVGMGGTPELVALQQRFPVSPQAPSGIEAVRSRFGRTGQLPVVPSFS